MHLHSPAAVLPFSDPVEFAVNVELYLPGKREKEGIHLLQELNSVTKPTWYCSLDSINPFTATIWYCGALIAAGPLRISRRDS